MTDTPSSPEPRGWPLLASLLLLAAGLVLGVYLVWIKVRLGYDSTFVSACNFGGKLNCDAVQTHPTSALFGLPIALFSIPTYLALAWLCRVGLAGGEQARRAVAFVAGIGTLTVLYSAVLGFISASQIGAFCIFCISMYAVNLGVTVLAFVSLGQGPVAVASQALGGLFAGAQPVGSAAMVLIGTGAAAWVGYDMTVQHYFAEQQQRIEAQFAGGGAAGDAVAEKKAGTTTGAKTGAGSAGASADKAPPKPAPRKVAAGTKVEPRLTKDGWDYFEFPVGPDDYVLGPADAKVTFIAFKDFECGFCRFVTSQTKKLKNELGGQVRWVFKHYPMNGDCNWRMGGTKMHEGACRASFAAHCAHEQGRFWQMHDMLYDNQKKFSDAELRGYAETLGLDLAKFDECYASVRPRKRIKKDVALAAKARIIGTPRLYVNNRSVDGSKASDVLAYVIRTAMKYPVAPPMAAEEVPTAETPQMVQAKTKDHSFFIDAFEGTIDKQGRARAIPRGKPAQVSWFQAEAACKKAGKRMCTEEEWVSACAGEPAVEYKGAVQRYKGTFTKGDVVGRMYPYGAIYDADRCRDSEDKYTGAAGETGSKPGCRTAEGIYDLAGNLHEWVGGADVDATMMGGDWRSSSLSGCRAGSKTYGAGIKNDTTGFRCCADAFVAGPTQKADTVDTAIAEIVGSGVPSDLALEAHDGGTIGAKTFQDKVTYLTFFASWCGNCRKQMPAIKEWQTSWEKQGFQVIGINVDRERAKGERYVKTLDPNFPIGYDPTARSMTDFDINAMPTSFIIGRDGVIKKRVVGYKDDNIQETRDTITSMLGG